MMLALLIGVASPACDVPDAESQRQMPLSYEAFDTASGPYAWRDLNGRGCTDAAVALLRSYRKANASRMTPEQRLESAFHIVQAYAFANRPAEALAALPEADSADAPEEWRAYVAAHVAFFRKDRAGLARAHSRYAAAAGSAAMRLKFIEGFVKCPDKNYMEAAHCGM